MNGIDARMMCNPLLWANPFFCQNQYFSIQSSAVSDQLTASLHRTIKWPPNSAIARRY